MEIEKHFEEESMSEDKDTKANQIAAKRQRSENWNDVDKELLKELIKKRVKQIENKNTDTNTNQIKKKAWQDIEKDFNSFCSCKKRTVGQLKSQWTTLKMTAKKEVSEFRLKTQQTGGGQAPPEVAMSGNDIAVWLPNEFVVDTNEYDSDIIFSKCEDESFANCIVIDEDMSEGELHNISKSTQKEAEPSTKIKNKALQRRKKNLSSKNVADESILKMAQTDVECRNELHFLQVEAEKKRIRNYDLKFDVLQAKLDFYKKKLSDNITA